jgi:hypothetical protein
LNAAGLESYPQIYPRRFSLETWFSKAQRVATLNFSP